MQSIPKCGSMRLKMASAVEGCLYMRLNVVPGRPSKYSNDRREDADILSMACFGRRCDVAAFTRLSWLKSAQEISPVATLRSDQSPRLLHLQSLIF